MKIRIMYVDKDMDEEKFQSYLEEQGYNCKRLRNGNFQRFSNKIGKKIYDEKGIPDFFVWNKKEYFFCEFKSLNDAWRISQIQWAIKHSNFPIVLALAIEEPIANEKFAEEKLEIDTAFEEQMRRINIAWRIKDYFLEEYVKEHPEIIGKKLFPDYRSYGGSYLGEIPREVVEKCNQFDEIFFKDKQKQEKIIDVYEENKPNIKEVLYLLQ
jgi:hypothetical protein